MNLDKILENKNVKLTPARKSILEILLLSNKPLCYEDIKDKISMDKATFYRNITKFEEHNLINSFESNDKKRYFEIRNIPHAHFICTLCNKVECIKDYPDFVLDKYRIDNIIIKGICAACNKINDN